MPREENKEHDFFSVREILQKMTIEKVANDTCISRPTLAKICADSTTPDMVRPSVINHLKLYFGRLLSNT